MRLLKIGRDGSNNIVVSDPRVSSKHAEITILNNGDILIEDKGSLNGTFVNNNRLIAGKAVSVRRGDHIVLGGVDLNWNEVPKADDNSAYAGVYSIGSDLRNDIIVNGNQVSRFHATIKKDKKGKYYIQDHSKNGTTVNGQRIPTGQDIKLNKGDKVSMGGQLVDLTKVMGKSSSGGKGVLVAAIAIACVGLLGVLAYILWPGGQRDYSKATACVFHEYHFVVTLEEDLYCQVLKKEGITGWPEIYEFGIDEYGKIGPMGNTARLVGEDPNKYQPLNLTATSFFVSEDGRMITNRHVVMPWDYNEDYTAQIHEQMGRIQQAVTNDPDYYQIFRRLCFKNPSYNDNDLQNWIVKYMTSPMKISGTTDFLATGEPYKMYNSTAELSRASVLNTSKDKDIDLAVMQLNNKKTPEEARAHCIDLNKAVTDVKALKPGVDKYKFFGYPAGLFLNLDNEKNFGLTPQIYEIGLSRLPGKYNMELQGQVLAGASGSPIINADGYLVGVIDRSIPGTSISSGVLAKFAVQLYKETLELEGN